MAYIPESLSILLGQPGMLAHPQYKGDTRTIWNISEDAYIQNWEQRNYASVFPLQYVILRGKRKRSTFAFASGLRLTCCRKSD
jgi:hypothetical protein